MNYRPRRIILTNYQSPGDIMMLTAAVRDLHRSHPGRFLTDVRTSCNQLWENNPYITPLDTKDPQVEIIECKDYKLIHNSNKSAYHFIHCFHHHLENILGIRIPATDFKADIYISDQEKSWISQLEEMGVKDKFWIIVPGGKYDYTAKWMHPDYVQEVVNHFFGKITFVQCGQSDHWHPKLNNVIDLTGKTDIRQFLRLVYHSVGVLSGITFAMHAAAGVEMKHSPPLNRAAVIVAGGREPAQWEAYPHHRFLSINGSLSCCDNGGCWKSRCTLIKDKDEKNNEDKICIFPVIVPKKKHVLPNYPTNKIDGELKIAKCLMMIKPKDIIRAIQWYYEGNMYEYGSNTKKIRQLAEQEKKKDKPKAKQVKLAELAQCT